MPLHGHIITIWVLGNMFIFITGCQRPAIMWLPFEIFSDSTPFLGKLAGKFASCCHLLQGWDSLLADRSLRMKGLPAGKESQIGVELRFPLPSLGSHFIAKRLPAEWRETPLVGCKNGGHIPKTWALFLQPSKEFLIPPAGRCNKAQILKFQAMFL